MRGRCALAAAVSVLIVSTGCTAATMHRAGPGRRTVRTSPPLSIYPVPEAIAGHLPRGVFYLYAGLPGQHLPLAGLWEIDNGQERLVTRGQAGRQVDLFGASPAGIIVSDNARISAGLARWTATGPAWLHPAREPGIDIDGQAPAISATGEIAYLVPPQGNSGAGDGSIWIRQTWTGADKRIYQSARYPLFPVFGPNGILALWPGGQYLTRSQRYVTFISPDGRIRRMPEDIPRLINGVLNDHAPGLALYGADGKSELLLLTGRRQRLPSGWEPLAWDPAGRQLLMVKGREIGLWSVSRPDLVKPIGPISIGYQIWEAEWLNVEAKL